MTLSSERLEQESEQTRLRLADALEELRARLSPGQVVDQLVDYAGEGGAGEFVRNLGQDVRRNPLPVTLIGAGIGWLMITNGRSHRGDVRGDGERMAAGMTKAGQEGSAPHSGERPRAGLSVFGRRRGRTVGTWTDSAAETAHAVGETERTAGAAVAEAGRQAGEWVSGLAERASSTLPSVEDVSSVYRSAASTASDTVHRLGDGATQLSRNVRSLAQFCAEQPLVVAALGLVLGTTIGAVLPSSKTENQLLGATSDALKDKVKGQASDVYEKAQSVVRDTVEAAGEPVEKAGSTGSTVGRPSDDKAEFSPAPAPAG
jgi:hypothetical protein